MKSLFNTIRQADKTKLFFWFFITVIVAWTLFPIGWTVATSLKTESDIYSWPPVYLPSQLTLNHYQTAYTTGVAGQGGFGKFIINSIIVAFSVKKITLFISLTTGYAVARLGGMLGGLAVVFILGSRLIPPIALLTPYMVLLQRINLTDSFIGIIAAHTFFVGPFAIWIMRNFFRSIPEELEEAARIDGSSKLNTYLKIILPLTTPGAVAVAIISFLWSWKEFLFAFTISRRHSVTLPVGLAKFLQDEFISWGALSAGAAFSLVPAIVFVVFFHKQLLEGLIAGTGLKG